MRLDAALEDPSYAGMSSTIVAGLVRDTGVSIAHVGDSRIYLIRSGTIRQLTVDHSLVMEQVKRGMISVEEAERSAVKNYIVRALGAEPRSNLIWPTLIWKPATFCCSQATG